MEILINLPSVDINVLFLLQQTGLHILVAVLLKDSRLESGYYDWFIGIGYGLSYNPLSWLLAKVILVSPRVVILPVSLLTCNPVF